MLTSKSIEEHQWKKKRVSSAIQETNDQSDLVFTVLVPSYCRLNNRDMSIGIEKPLLLCPPILPSLHPPGTQPGTPSPGSLSDFLLFIYFFCRHHIVTILSPPCCGSITHMRLMIQSVSGSWSDEVRFLNLIYFIFLLGTLFTVKSVKTSRAHLPIHSHMHSYITYVRTETQT